MIRVTFPHLDLCMLDYSTEYSDGDCMPGIAEAGSSQVEAEQHNWFAIASVSFRGWVVEKQFDFGLE